MNLPNSLTVTRIFLVPLLVVVLLTQFEGRLILGIPKELVGAAIFGLASLTDWLDGYLARRRKQITTVGQVMDPLADKLLTSAALISLVQMDLAPAWMVATIIGREFAVTGLRSLAYARGVAMPASPLGKIKMIAQVVAILALILTHEQPKFYMIGRAALWVVVIAALVSAADYFRRFNAILSPRLAELSPEPQRTSEAPSKATEATELISFSPVRTASRAELTRTIDCVALVVMTTPSPTEASGKLGTPVAMALSLRA
jgi:CDP-diacylglycerol--glycerol-3-phosphate 3-phosphatidyltransferase